jgi:DNA-binding NarL/FixJ family response regulator
MFRKVLIAEDIDSINIAVIQAMKDLGITQIEHAKYCDDALLKIKKALLDNEPFEVLISDLSFKTDHRAVTLQSGDELIAAVKALQPDIKIVAYSIEDKSFRIKSLFEIHGIEAYIHKGRQSIAQLKTAMDCLLQNENYISPEMAHLLQDQTVQEIDDYDILLIKQLSIGVPQEKMVETLKAMGVSPNSKSTIEKRIGKLKDYFKANNPTHLIAIAKDVGII